MLATLTLEAISSLSSLIVASIVVGLPACLTYHFLVVTTPLMQGLLAPVILWFPSPLIPLLVEEGFSFIVSLLYIDGNIIHLLVRAVYMYRRSDLQLIVQAALKPPHFEGLICHMTWDKAG